MAKYQILMEFTTRLSREVEADSAQDAEQLAETMYQEWKNGENAHVIGAEWHRSFELLSDAEPRRYGR